MEQFTIYLKEPQKRQLLIEFLMRMEFLEWETSKRTSTSVSNSVQKSVSPAKDFVNKWKGFLSDTDAKDSKWDYLSDKYL